MENVEYDFYDDWKRFIHTVSRACEAPVDYLLSNNDTTTHNRYDKGYKYLLSVKKNFIDFVKCFMKISLNEELTENNITLMDKEFITVDFDKRESDLIYEVKTGDKKVYFILLEIQSKPDRKMAYRLLNYMVEIWRKTEITYYFKPSEFTLPQIIPCVLYNGKSRWTAPIEFKDLYENINDNLEYFVNFKYILIDVHRYKASDLLKMSNIISSAFYLDSASKKNFQKRLETLAKNIANLDRYQIKDLQRWIINVMAKNNNL